MKKNRKGGSKWNTTPVPPTASLKEPVVSTGIVRGARKQSGAA